MLPSISFETGRKTQTQSSGQPDELRQQMEVWFYPRIETAAERPTPRVEKGKDFTPALLPSASGGPFARDANDGQRDAVHFFALLGDLGAVGHHPSADGVSLNPMANGFKHRSLKVCAAGQTTICGTSRNAALSLKAFPIAKRPLESSASTKVSRI